MYPNIYLVLLFILGIAADAKFGIPIGEDGRWGAHHAGFEFLSKHKQNLKAMAIDPELNESILGNTEVYRIVLMDTEFWSDLDFVLENYIIDNYVLKA